LVEGKAHAILKTRIHLFKKMFPFSNEIGDVSIKGSVRVHKGVAWSVESTLLK
jgi:hypothetical protein